MEKKSIGPRIDETTEKWLQETFETKTAGAEFLLRAMPGLYKRSLKNALDRLEKGEKYLIIDLHNSYAMTPQILGQGVAHQVKDGIDLDGLDKKWKVDKKKILEKLASLHPFELACLEIWATAFWQAGHWEGEGALEKYIES